MLITEQLSPTGEVTLSRQCRACGFEATAYDRFCRQCGAARTAWLDSGLTKDTPTSLAITDALGLPSSYETMPLVQNDAHRQVSAPLIKSLTASLPLNKVNGFDNRLLKGLLLALIVLPIWLLIISLSPFDAFLAAKTAVKDG